MYPRIRNIILPMARSFSLNRLIGWSGQHAAFPFYHTVSPGPLPHIGHLYRVMTPEAFERELEQLLKWFEPVSLGDYLDREGEQTRKPCMVLTFDDGLKGCYEYIAPLLKRKGVPGVFFLNNSCIDNRSLFYRYKASLLAHQVKEDRTSLERAAGFLKTGPKRVEASIMLVGYDQAELLDALAVELDLDFHGYLRSREVYMNSSEIRELMDWGFDLGGHSATHIEFRNLEPDEMIRQVRLSLEDLQQRFGVTSGYFSFPFTSDDVPKKVIETLLEEGAARALMGSAGLKGTDHRAFIQRIPMEQSGSSAIATLKAEYLYYLLKRRVGRHRLRY
jgi:peptidoglycan/xylan/chitin deacetylase (PgdA/CDA1 family)